jgi:carbon monoxide dehydrogenase subunit G
MAHAENHVTVPRSGPEVYAFLTDLDNVASWIPAIQRLALVRGTPGTVGAEYEATVDVGGATRGGRLSIVALDPPRGMTVRIAAFPLRIDGTVTIDDRGDSSVVTVVLDAPTGGLLRLMEPQIQEALTDTLRRLPRLADAVSTGPR